MNKRKAVCIKHPDTYVFNYKVGSTYLYYREDGAYYVHLEHFLGVYSLSKDEFDEFFADIVKFRNDKIDEILND